MSPLLFNFFIMDLICALNDQSSSPSLNGSGIPCLFYADDITILSERKGGLQKSMSILWDYCLENNLVVNTDKTKVMTLFNANKRISSDLMVMYGDKILEQVKSFTYCGIS